MTAALPSLDGPVQPPARAERARRLVVLLHGYGADGNDLFGLAQPLSGMLPDAAFVAPHAPDPCEMAPTGRQWFSLADYDPDLLRHDPREAPQVWQALRTGVEQAAPVLDAFLDAQLARWTLDESALALVGFSQGTMMALHVGLRRRRAPACVVGYSGALTGADDLARGVVSRPPILLVHGDSDPVVPVAALDHAAYHLRAAGLTIHAHRRPGLEHGIDPEGLQLGAEFLADHLAGG